MAGKRMDDSDVSVVTDDRYESAGIVGAGDMINLRRRFLTAPRSGSSETGPLRPQNSTAERVLHADHVRSSIGGK